MKILRVLQTAQFTFIFVGNGPHFKNTMDPRRYYTNSFDRKWSLCRWSAEPPLTRGPIGSNRSNRLKAGPACTHCFSNFGNSIVYTS